MTRRKISVVVPALNEAGNLERLYDRVIETFESALPDYDWELLITDNHSSDATYEIVQSLSSQDPRVRGYRFSRDFGYQRSILAGYLLASGDAVVQLDADMQDRPELLPELVSRWEAGAQVVYGIRLARQGDPKLLSAMRRGFYRVVDWLSEDHLPRDVGDFRLVDRVVVEVLRHSHDSSPYLRGAIASMGFKQDGFEYERDDRSEGETKFSMRSLFRLAFDGILNHSTRPLQFATFTAVVVVMVALLALVAYFVGRVGLGQDWPAGFVTLAMLQLVTILLNAAFLGIIGAYIGRMFTQMKSAPLVIVEVATDSTPKVLTSIEGTDWRSLNRDYSP